MSRITLSDFDMTTLNVQGNRGTYEATIFQRREILSRPRNNPYLDPTIAVTNPDVPPTPGLQISRVEAIVLITPLSRFESEDEEDDEEPDKHTEKSKTKLLLSVGSALCAAAAFVYFMVIRKRN